MIMESFFQAFLYRLLTTAFYQIIAYFPFRNHLRFSPGRVFLTAGIAQAVLAAVYACATMHGAPVTAATGFSVLAGFAVFLVNVRTDRGKILFLYVFVLDYVLFVQGLAYFTESLLFYSPFMTFGSVHTLVLIFLFTAVTAPFVLFFLEKSSMWMFQTDAPSFWNIAWLLPAFTTLIVTMYTCDGTLMEIRDIRFLIGRILLIFVQFLVYYFLLQALHLFRGQETLREHAAQQETLLAISRAQYRQLCRHMQEIREARHDLSQHLRLIQHYLDTGRKEDLQDYLKRYAQSLPCEGELAYCDNYAVNTIVTYYEEKAKNEGYRLPPISVCRIRSRCRNRNFAPCSATFWKMPWMPHRRQRAKILPSSACWEKSMRDRS